MTSKLPVVKENKGRLYVEYQRECVAYPTSCSTLEKDPIKRWKKLAERDEESYWRRKFREMI